MRRRDFVKKTVIGAAVLSASPVASLAVGQKSAFDVALLNGRVMDPESGFVGIRNVGISGGIIRAITRAPLEGRTVIDAAGLVVAPGFIDLRQYSHDVDNYRVKGPTASRRHWTLRAALRTSTSGTRNVGAARSSTTASALATSRRACWSCTTRELALALAPFGVFF